MRSQATGHLTLTMPKVRKVRPGCAVAAQVLREQPKTSAKKDKALSSKSLSLHELAGITSRTKTEIAADDDEDDVPPLEEITEAEQ